METLIAKLGYLAAIVGFLLSLLSGVMRVTGMFYIFNYQVITLLQAGVALMVFACMIRLYFPDSST